MMPGHTRVSNSVFRDDMVIGYTQQQEVRLSRSRFWAVYITIILVLLI